VARLNSLIRHDAAVLRNEVWRALPGWRDRLTAGAAVLLVGYGLVRALPGPPLWGLALLMGGIGALASRGAARRLRYHEAEGMLAADALRTHLRWGYRLAWHAGVLGCVAAVLAGRPDGFAAGMAGYLVGAAIGWVASQANGTAAWRPSFARGRPVAAWLRAHGRGSRRRSL
jgi:hypothetical protein